MGLKKGEFDLMTKMYAPYPEEKELTLRGMIIGALITAIFTTSNIYLGLKVGLTFSTAIPAVVISMVILRMFSGANILEYNMVQTQASAAGTLSSIIFVLPGLLMIGYWHSFHFWQTLLVCVSGGMLGVIFTIPLRHVMVVKSDLPYPEGVAAADILMANCPISNANSEIKNSTVDYEHQDKKHQTKKVIKNISNKQDKIAIQQQNQFNDILFGGVLASLVSFASSGLKLLVEGTGYWFTYGRSIFQLPLGFSLAMLSAGYIIGITSGIAILIGVLITWGIIVPVLTAERIMTDGISVADFATTIWQNDVRFIGVGTLAISAVWALITLIKPIIKGIKHSFNMMNNASKYTTKRVARTEQDLPPKVMLIICSTTFIILLGTFYSFITDTGLNHTLLWSLVFLAVIFSFVIGFMIAAVCGYMAGLVGSSTSPISGISIVAIIAISLLLLFFGDANGIDGSEESNKFSIALAIFTTSTVLVIASISNDNLQDLKTGYIIHATPWRQQIALLIGCIVGATVISPVLQLLYEAYGFTDALPRAGMDEHLALMAPQAIIMTTISKGIFQHNLEWTMIIIGICIGIVIIAIDSILRNSGSKFHIPALAVGMGIYLSPMVTMPLIVGSVLSWIISRRAKHLAIQHVVDYEAYYRPIKLRGTLIASGFIVGESLAGIMMAIIIIISVNSGNSETPLAIDHWLMPIYGDSWQLIQTILSISIFILCCMVFYYRTLTSYK